MGHDVGRWYHSKLENVVAVIIWTEITSIADGHIKLVLFYHDRDLVMLILQAFSIIPPIGE